MPESSNDEILRKANLRLCRLHYWPNATGYGFTIVYHHDDCSGSHVTGSIVPNTPASTSGLQELDVILAVNQQDVTKASHSELVDTITHARDSNIPLELLVVEQRFYKTLMEKNISMDVSSALIIDSPTTKPND